MFVPGTYLTMLKISVLCKVSHRDLILRPLDSERIFPYKT